MTRMLMLAIVVLILLMLARTANAYDTAQLRARYAICQTFGRYCGQALRVAYCESRYRTWATNGQYLGLFQMGAYARSTYGHATGAWGQSRAAYRYFVASGRDWSPWQCRP